MKKIVYMLDGYLSSIRRLAYNNCDYWAIHLKIDTDVEAAISNYFLKYDIPKEVIEIKKIGYDVVKTFFDKFIVEQLKDNTENQVTMLIDDIVEYYGLASTTLNPKGVWNPLLEGAFEITVKDESNFHESLVYFLVEVENQAILTGFGIRT